MPPTSLLSSTRADLAARLRAWGYKDVHAKAVWQHVHRDAAADFATRAGLPSGLADRLHTELPITRPTVARESHSSDGFTRKFLLTLADGAQVETVLMRYDGRTTVRVSTQAGWAMGCVF